MYHVANCGWKLEGVDLRLGQGGGNASAKRSQLTATLLDVQQTVRREKLVLLTEPAVPLSMRRDVWDVCGQPTAAPPSRGRPQPA